MSNTRMALISLGSLVAGGALNGRRGPWTRSRHCDGEREELTNEILH